MPRGGKRPGAGRPRKEVKDWQSHNLLILRSVFTDDDMRQIAESLKRDLMAGDWHARKDAIAYIIGPPPKELTLVGDEDAPLGIQVKAIDYRVISAALAPGPIRDSESSGEG